MSEVLLVDDEPELLDVMAEALAGRGHAVVPCTSGREAQARIGQAAPLDFAVIDWSLPDVSGRDLILDLSTRQPNCRIVIVTGYGEAIVSNTLVGDRVLAILRKPFRMAALAQLLAESPSRPPTARDGGDA